MIVFIFSIDWINEYYWCINIKHRKNRKVYFLLIFSFFLNFYIFFNIYKFIIKFLSYYIAKFFPGFHVFIKTFFLFYHKIHTFSLIKIYFIYTYFWKEYANIILPAIFVLNLNKALLLLSAKKISNSTIIILKIFHLYNIVMNVQIFWNIYHYILSN